MDKAGKSQEGAAGPQWEAVQLAEPQTARMHTETDTEQQAAQQIPQIMSEMQQAADVLQRVGGCVAIFGSARLPPDSPWCAVAETLGAALARAGFPVVAGGGMGIMQAANKGAFEAGGISVGLNIKLPKERHDNPYQTHRLHFDYFASRKATFFMHSVAYIALPGGLGTLDELFEVMTLVQTRKVPPAPIVLMGTDFWRGLLDWMRGQLQAGKLISGKDLGRLVVTDDTRVAIDHITQFCSENPLICRHVALPE